METISAPATVTETVTDLDIELASGSMRSYTLREGDGFIEGEAAVIISLVSPPKVITVYKKHVALLEVTVRLIKRIIPTIEAIKKPSVESHSPEATPRHLRSE